MTARYLVDTGRAIDYLNGQQRTRKRLGELGEGGLAFSMLSLAEATGITRKTVDKYLDQARAILAMPPTKIAAWRQSEMEQAGCREGIRLAALEFCWEHREVSGVKLSPISEDMLALAFASPQHLDRAYN